jgi:hypothetical protein
VEGIIAAANHLTWPGAFAVGVIAIAGAWVLGKVFGS